MNEQNFIRSSSGPLQSPAMLIGHFNSLFQAYGQEVVLSIDISWIFIKRGGHKMSDFGDVNRRQKSLGKWIIDCGKNEIIDKVELILPLVHSGVEALSHHKTPSSIQPLIGKSE